MPAALTHMCVQALSWSPTASSLLSVSYTLPFSLLLFLPLPTPPSGFVFLFSRKSVRGKGKGQKRKRKKSRYKSWSLYVVPLLSHSLEPTQGPNLTPAHRTP